ncbi:hypothetical protein [Mesorhizobium helmanticense]|uniref:hypothetical protein n=1 Tax=Mesorhizobium helmanticense TaxID=1776423 RepID=UPI0011B28A1F|nr:hypothetical protein [Mesorhizobium helmanticense]
MSFGQALTQDSITAHAKSRLTLQEQRTAGAGNPAQEWSTTMVEMCRLIAPAQPAHAQGAHAPGHQQALCFS